MEIDILTVAAIVSAASVIFGIPIAVYKFIDKISDKQKEHDEKFLALKEENRALKTKINKENTVICEALLACLDGLEQLGANHSVPKAHEKLSNYLNSAAHG